MKPGSSRFEFFLNQFNPLLITAAKQKNPALWLYRNNARTPLFMLEALAKMYSGLHNKKKFEKMQERFKLLEDAIGAIDYYDMVAQDLAANKKIPASIVNYLHAQSREKIQSLNEILSEEGWLQPADNRVMKIQKRLRKMDWLDESEEVKMIDEYYGEAIYKIVEFAQSKNYIFSNMEEEVHELRRKLRWLSIYPQALRGAIQLGRNPSVPKHLSKYLTKEIVTSSFNKMPEKGVAKNTLQLEQNYFYSLSWMIAELGNIKDDGLHIVAMQEAMQQTSSITPEAALKKIYQLLGSKQQKMQGLLEKAGSICKTYFSEQNLEHLIMGVKKEK